MKGFSNGPDISRERVFGVRLVEVVGSERVLLLPLKPSLQIVEHSLEGFNWEDQGIGPAQLALGILYEVTGNVELSRGLCYSTYRRNINDKFCKYQ